MAEFRYLDFDCTAWVADTKHLRPVERGVYFDLLILAWLSPECRLPNDPKTLVKVLQYRASETPILHRIIQQFWTTDQRKKWLTQKRLVKEFKASRLRRKHSLDGSKSRWSKEKSQTATPLTVPVPVPVPVVSPQTPRKRGAHTTAPNSSGKKRKLSNVEQAFRDIERYERKARGGKNSSAENPGSVSELGKGDARLHRTNGRDD